MGNKSLQYHYDLYDGQLKEFLKELVEFIKDNIDVTLTYPESYINFNLPLDKNSTKKQGKKFMWIDERNKNYKNINLRMFNIDYEKEQFEELKNISNDKVELSNGEEQNLFYSDVKIKEPVELNEDFKKFIKRKYEEYKRFYNEDVDIRYKYNK